MRIQVEFHFDGQGNFGFKEVYLGTYNELVKRYPDVTFSKVDIPTIYPICDSPGGRCGSASMNIINLENNKTTVLSFWDRSIEITYDDMWPDLDVVHLIGGIGMYESSEEIKNKRGVLYSPLSYVLDREDSYYFVDKIREPYDYNKKIKKACFIGWIYQTRETISNILKKHPLFEIYDIHSGYRNLSYYEKMNEYALTLSLNGNGEWCIRDSESMGLGIPIIRSELMTQFYEKLTPNIDYVVGSEPSKLACFYYPEVKPEQIAEQFIESIEKVIGNEELLTNMSKKNVNYYENNFKPINVIENFFNVFDINILK